MRKHDIIKFDDKVGYVYNVLYRNNYESKLKEFILVKFSEKVGGVFEELLDSENVIKIGRIIRFKNKN